MKDIRSTLILSKSVSHLPFKIYQLLTFTSNQAWPLRTKLQSTPSITRSPRLRLSMAVGARFSSAPRCHASIHPATSVASRTRRTPSRQEIFVSMPSDAGPKKLSPKPTRRQQLTMFASREYYPQVSCLRPSMFTSHVPAKDKSRTRIVSTPLRRPGQSHVDIGIERSAYRMMQSGYCRVGCREPAPDLDRRGRRLQDPHEDWQTRFQDTFCQDRGEGSESSLRRRPQAGRRAVKSKCLDSCSYGQYAYLWMQQHDGALSFATDAWTSPNHRAFIAFTVHLEAQGEPLSFLLDFVELPKSHSGKNMAAAFTEILTDFGVEKKVSDVDTIQMKRGAYRHWRVIDPRPHLRQRLQQRHARRRACKERRGV
jgi:hypothetical protein